MTPSRWTFGASTLSRVIESEGPLLSPFELYAECTQGLLDENKHWLIPRFQDWRRVSGRPRSRAS